MDWNDDTIARLRQLWDAGLSTAEIGRRLNVSKNAVVGKAHRMMLPPRPSPIRRDGPATPRVATPRRVVGPTLPPLPAVSLDPPPRAEPPAPRPPSPAPRHEAAPVRSERREEAPAASAPAAAAHAEPQPAMRVVPSGNGTPFLGRQSACCWPLGDPGTRSFRFCDVASLPGKPYCAEHAQVAYVKVRDRREEAA